MDENILHLGSELKNMKIQNFEERPIEEAEKELVSDRTEFNKRVKNLPHSVQNLKNAYGQAMKSFEHPDFISQTKDPGDIISEDIGDWLINEIIQAYKELEKLRQWVTEPLSAEEIESDDYLEQYKDMILNAKKQREKYFHAHKNNPELRQENVQKLSKPNPKEIDKQQKLELQVLELEKQVNKLRLENANLKSSELTSTCTSPFPQTQTSNEDDNNYETFEHKFHQEHILGFGDHKPQNDLLLESGKLKLKTITKNRGSNERFRGDLPGQVKLITKEDVNVVDTGHKKYGTKRRGRFIVTGLKMSDNSIKLHHFDGMAEKQFDGGYFHPQTGSIKERSGSDTAEYSCLSDHTKNDNIPDGVKEEISPDDWSDYDIIGVKNSCSNSNLVVEDNQPQVDEDQIFACQYCDADEFVNQQSLDAHQKQFHQFVSDDTKTVLEATSDGDIQTSVTPHYQSIRPKSQNSLHVQYSSVFYDESTDSEKEDDGGNVAEGKRPSWTVIRNLKKNYQLCRDSLNTVRDKCLRKGTYIENFIEDRLVDYISKILQKMKTDRSKYVPTPVFPIGKSESSIPLMRKYCKDNISLQIDCSFKKRQVEDIIHDQNVMDCEKSHFWKDSKLMIQMYGPIEEFEKETKSLFDKLDDIFKKNGLISQVARLYCSNQYLIKTRLYLDPDTDPVFVKRRYNTTHEHILSLSKQNPNRQAQYEKLFPRFRSPMRNLKAEKNEEFIPPLPQDEVHPHYKHTCRDPEWRERMDYIKSNIIDLYKKCGWNPPENSIDSCFGECYDTRDDIFKFIQLISGGGSPEELMPEKFGYERTFLHTSDSRINNVSVIYEKPPPDFGMFPDKYRDVSLRDKYSCANSDNTSTDESESDEWISLSSSSSSIYDSNESLYSFESLSPSDVTEAIGTKSGGHYKYYSDGSFNFIRNPEKPYARQNLFDDVRAIFSDHPGENYQCEFCDKIFAKKRNLREHIKNHPPKKLLRIWLSEHQASVIQTLKKSKLSFHNSMPSDNLKSL